MATHPKKAKTKQKEGKAKVAEAIKVNGRWRVKCYKCGLLRPAYGSWTTAATAAWRHGRH
jgi:adenine-specific DNA methylase